jgi:hypothetical protein
MMDDRSVKVLLLCAVPPVPSLDYGTAAAGRDGPGRASGLGFRVGVTGAGDVPR